MGPWLGRRCLRTGRPPPPFSSNIHKQDNGKWQMATALGCANCTYTPCVACHTRRAWWEVEPAIFSPSALDVLTDDPSFRGCALTPEICSRISFWCRTKLWRSTYHAWFGDLLSSSGYLASNKLLTEHMFLGVVGKPTAKQTHRHTHQSVRAVRNAPVCTHMKRHLSVTNACGFPLARHALPLTNVATATPHTMLPGTLCISPRVQACAMAQCQRHLDMHGVAHVCVCVCVCVCWATTCFTMK